MKFFTLWVNARARCRDVYAAGRPSTLAHTHSNSIILTTIQAIDKALKDLASQESPNYSATVRKYGIDRTTLLRRHRGLVRSQAVNVVNTKSLLTP